MHDDDSTVDPAAVAADDRLIDELASGATPPTREQVAAVLAAWRDSVRFDPEPIYEEIVERHLAAAPRILTPVLDAQSLAYRGMSAADAVADDEIRGLAARIHAPLDPQIPPRDQLLLPEDHERERWDRNRVDPRPVP